MNRKRIIIVTIIIILVIVLGLWISGIIPKQVARIFATNYLKKNFPEKQYEYVDIEWSSSFGGYSIKFKDENDKIVGFLMNNKYFPITPGQGTFGLEDNYRVEYHNDNLYSEFMDKYNKKENAFTRVVQSTVEGDIIIIDVLYETRNNKIHLVKDDTRDEFLAQEDRSIKYKTYEKTGVWNYQNSQYWVVYNGELPDGTKAEYSINSDDLFIIATIN